MRDFEILCQDLDCKFDTAWESVLTNKFDATCGRGDLVWIIDEILN